MGKGSKRIEYLDVAKGLAILAIVLGHALTNNEDIFKTSHPALINWISFFNVYTFCFVNGILYSGESAHTPVKSIIKKAKSYYLPFLCFNCFFFVFHNLFVYLNFSNAAPMRGVKTIAVGFVKMLLGKLQILTGPLWFLRALLVMVVIYILLDAVSSRIAKGRFRYLINGVVIAAIWLVGTKITVTETFNLKDALRFLLFFYFGVIYKRFDLNRFVEKRAVLWFAGLFAASVILALTTTAGLEVTQGYTLLLLVRIVGVFMVICASQLPFVKDAGLIKLLGKSSMYIMALHFLAFKLVSVLIMNVYKLDRKVLADTPVIRDGSLGDIWVPVYVIVGIVIPVIVYLAKNKIVDGIKSLYIKKEVQDAEFIMMNTPCHNNLGDHAIALSEEHFFKEHFPEMKYLEITGKKLWKFMDSYKKYISKDAVIGIHGGGYLGTLWINEEVMSRLILKSFPENRIIFFPQTVYFSKDDNGERELKISRDIYKDHPGEIALFCRDRGSYEFARTKLGCLQNVYLVPDMVLSYKPEVKVERGSTGLLCLRHDLEKTSLDTDLEKIKELLDKKGFSYEITDTIAYGMKNVKHRDEALQEIFERFSGASFVVTDRLHGMILSAITGTPCLAMDNVSHKVSGGYEWVKNLGYISFLSEGDDPEEKLMELLRNSGKKWEYDEKRLSDKYAPLIAELEEKLGFVMEMAN